MCTTPKNSTSVALAARTVVVVVAIFTVLSNSWGQETGQRTENRASSETSPAPGPGRPNILFLMGDDWSWPHASAYGDAVIKTPTFDRIAREGVLFSNAFISAPSCTPSRLAIASGQYHWRLEGGKNLGGSLKEKVPVYPEMLQAAGYKIGFCRKGATPSKYTYTGRDPFGARFQSFADFYSKRPSDQPFCFWYGAGEPHRPYVWRDGVKTGMNIDDVEVPACLPDNETTRTDICDYYEKIQRFDAYAAEILATLEENGELDNTFVVMSGDNGLPFPRCKATLYDTGTRVPLAIRWGGKVPAGRKIRDFVSLCDLAPTFVEAAGLTAAEQMTGKTLLPLLTSTKSGQVDPSRDHVLTAMERHVFPYPSRAIRTADFLYVMNFRPADWPTGQGSGPPPTYDFTIRHWPMDAEAFSFNVDPSPTKQFMLHHPEDPTVKPLYDLSFGRRKKEELYDLKIDPEQLKNVAGTSAYSQIEQTLETRLKAALKANADPRFSPTDANK